MKTILLYLALLLPALIRAQTHQEVGIIGGVANYYGDLQPKLFPSYGYKPMGGIIYKYFMSPYIGLRVGASYTNLTAADSLSGIPANEARNLSFATHLYELHAALEINFVPIEIMKKNFSPYVFGGMSVFYFDPYADDPNGKKVFLQPLSTEGEGLAAYPDRRPYSLVNMAFPFGGGFKFFIAKTIVFAAEMGLRYTNTDYLDDVSKSYVNLNTLLAAKGPEAVAMSYRGNTVNGWNGAYPAYGTPRGDNQSNDWFWYGNVTITIFLHSFDDAGDDLKTRCPQLFK